MYYQPLDIDQGVGRYLYPLQGGNTDDATMNRSFWSMEKGVSESMTIDVTLKTAFPVDGLHSPSHPALTTAQDAPDLWTCHWCGTGAVLDTDFVLLYRLAQDVSARIELLTSRYADQGEGTAMAVITAGDDLEEITYGTDWMFVLDVSGSMSGDKLRVLTDATAQATSRLRPEDRFQVVLFSNQHRWLTRAWVAPRSPEASSVVSQPGALKSVGGTNMFGALVAAYERLDVDRPSAIILMSDGVANTGPSESRDFLEMAQEHDGRLFTFVMETGVSVELRGATVVHPQRLPSRPPEEVESSECCSSGAWLGAQIEP